MHLHIVPPSCSFVFQQLRIRIQRSSNGNLAIDQSHYVAGIVQTYLKEADPPYIDSYEPSAVVCLAATGGGIFHDPAIYTQNLLHLCHSRRDVRFAAHKLCQFARCPYQIHWAPLCRIYNISKATLL